MSKERQTKFIAAKVNINQNIFADNKKELIRLIPEALKVKKSLKKNSWNWRFAEVKEYEKDYIFGKLVRSRHESVNVDDGDNLVSFDIPKPVARKSRFLYHIPNEVLIFEESELNRKDFTKAFGNLIFANNICIGEVKIKLIPIKEHILSEIRSIDILTKIEFDIIPPNMIEKKTFKGLNDIISNENATRMKTVLENEEGLNKEGEIIHEGIEMVSSAYGEVKAYGYRLETRKNKRRGTHKKVKVRTKYMSQDSIHMRRFETDNESELIKNMQKFAIEMIRNILM